ncbi:MAG: DUF1559 domain-containing protein [Pirellulales bacterium]|nr:DUF1559 domain-containing protein [Pirellulales bacterium]
MSILFTCPHCGTQTNVADEYAGQTGPCAACGKPITVPGGASCAAGPAKSSSSGWIIVLAVVGGVGVLMLLVCAGLLLPAVQAAREAARRVACVNNMRQIGLGLMNFEAAHKRYPNYSDPRAPEGEPISWRVELLPQMEQGYLHDQYDPNQPWDSPVNGTIADPMPTIYRCPSSGNAAPLETDYLGVSGPGAVFQEKGNVSMKDIRDGASNTIVVIESHPSGIHWMEPADAKTEDFDPLGASPLSSAHPGVANAVFADGSVRSLSDDIDPAALKAMTTIQGGEQAPPGAF